MDDCVAVPTAITVPTMTSLHQAADNVVVTTTTSPQGVTMSSVLHDVATLTSPQSVTTSSMLPRSADDVVVVGRVHHLHRSGLGDPCDVNY